MTNLSWNRDERRDISLALRRYKISAKEHEGERLPSELDERLGRSWAGHSFRDGSPIQR